MHACKLTDMQTHAHLALLPRLHSYGGPDVIRGGCHVVGYEELNGSGPGGRTRVAALLEDGSRLEGDVLIGTDGIWSKVRKQLLGDDPAHYSGYTCYTVRELASWACMGRAHQLQPPTAAAETTQYLVFLKALQRLYRMQRLLHTTTTQNAALICR